MFTHPDRKVHHMTAPEPNRPIAAAVSMVTSMAIIGAIDIYVALLAETISVWQFLFCRTVISLPLIVFLSWCGFGTIRPKRFWNVAFRSALIGLGMCCYFSALAFMPIAMALAGLFTSPIFVLLITAFVLGQSIGRWRIFAVLLGFLGILIVLGPSMNSLGLALLLPLMGGILYASGVVATRALCAGESTLALLLGIFSAQAVIGACVLLGLSIMRPEYSDGGMAFLLRTWVWPLGDALPYLLLQAVGSVVGVSFLNRAYQLGEATQVAVFEYTIMIFGPFFGWWLLGQPVTSLQVVGIVLIASAGILIAVRAAKQ